MEGYEKGVLERWGGESEGGEEKERNSIEGGL
jgi:hypothetical protein